MSFIGNSPRLAAGSLQAAVFLALPLAIAAPLGLAPLLLAAAFGVLVGDGWPARLHRRFAIASVTLTILVAWGAASALWSIDPDRSLAMAGRLALTFLSGGILLDKALRLDRRGRRGIAAALSAGTGIGVAALIFEAATNESLLRFGRALLGAREPMPTMLNRAATVSALMVWPAAYAFYRRAGAIPALLFLAFSIAALAAHENTTALLATLCGLAAAVAAMALPAPIRRLVVAGSVAGILAAPAIVSALAGAGDLHLRVKPSAVHRIMIWEFTVERIDERPWLGWGLEAARDLPGGGKEVTFMTRDGPWTRQALPLHTHNAALQIRVELGIVGIAIFALLIVGIGLAIGRVGDRTGHAARIGLLVTALAVSMASYGVWQFWWLSGVALAIAATIGVGLPDPEETDTSDRSAHIGRPP